MSTHVPEELPVSEFRARLSEVIHEVLYSGARTYLTRNGRRVAAIVPADEAEFLDRAEDAHLNRLADDALAEQRATGEPNIPFEKVIEMLNDDSDGNREAA